MTFGLASGFDGQPQWPTHDLFAATLSHMKPGVRASPHQRRTGDATKSGDLADATDGDGAPNLLEYRARHGRLANDPPS